MSYLNGCSKSSDTEDDRETEYKLRTIGKMVKHKLQMNDG